MSSSSGTPARRGTATGRGLRPAAATCAAVLAAASLSSCADEFDRLEASSSDSPTEGSPTGSPSPTTSVEPTEAASPTPELPETPPAEDTPAGRIAFAEFVVDRWGYSLATNDPSAVTDLSRKGAECQGCADLRKELTKRERQGWYVDFPGATVVRTTVGPAAPGGAPGSYVARSKIDIPASTSYFDDGALRNDNPGHKGATFEVRMQLQGKRFVLLAFRLADGG